MRRLISTQGLVCFYYDGKWHISERFGGKETKRIQSVTMTLFQEQHSKKREETEQKQKKSHSEEKKQNSDVRYATVNFYERSSMILW